MIDDDAKIKGRLLVAAYNSYGKHFGPRAVEAAEADLLGEAIEAIRFALSRSNGTEEDAYAEITWEAVSKMEAFLTKAKGGAK